MNSWLIGVPAKKISDYLDIWEINISGYGPAEVGPYKILNEYNKSESLKIGVRLDAHHIVAVEHLNMIDTGFSPDDAPCISIANEFHVNVFNKRIAAEQYYIGGRPRDGKPIAGRSEVLELYREVYTSHTPFYELYQIAINILKQPNSGVLWKKTNIT